MLHRAASCRSGRRSATNRSSCGVHFGRQAGRCQLLRRPGGPCPNQELTGRVRGYDDPVRDCNARLLGFCQRNPELARARRVVGALGDISTCVQPWRRHDQRRVISYAATIWTCRSPEAAQLMTLHYGHGYRGIHARDPRKVLRLRGIQPLGYPSNVETFDVDDPECGSGDGGPTDGNMASQSPAHVVNLVLTKANGLPRRYPRRNNPVSRALFPNSRAQPRRPHSLDNSARTRA